MDDTLFAESDYVKGGFRASGEWVEKNLGVSGFASTAETLFSSGRRGKIFDETLAALGAKPDAEIVTRLVMAYREHTPKLQLLPDAREALVWARVRFALALISDGYLDVQRRKAAALGLDDIISTLIFTDEWGRDFWKPAPRAFEETMRIHGGTAAGFVYVADNPRKDFIAPRALGWRTVRIRRPGGEHATYEPSPAEGADCEICDLTELKLMLTPAEKNASE